MEPLSHSAFVEELMLKTLLNFNVTVIQKVFYIMILRDEFFFPILVLLESFKKPFFPNLEKWRKNFNFFSNSQTKKTLLWSSANQTAFWIIIWNSYDVIIICNSYDVIIIWHSCDVIILWCSLQLISTWLMIENLCLCKKLYSCNSKPSCYWAKNEEFHHHQFN